MRMLEARRLRGNMMADSLATLADRMVGSRTIGFIGAGASVRLGLPLWKELIGALYGRAMVYDDAIPRPESTLDYRWLAEVYSQVISKNASLTEALNSIFDDHQRHHPARVNEPERLHDLIARLPFKHFITTNYDRFIEDACDRVFETVEGREPTAGERCLTRDGRLSDAFSNFLGAFSHDTHRSVLHLHGTLQGEHVTLALGEYNEQYLQDAMLLRMFSIFATSTVVFIGASLQDADLMELVRRSTYHAGGRVRHYALIVDDRQYEEDLLRRNYGIEPIFYSPGPDGSHEQLERKLERLLELVEPRRGRAVERANGNARPVKVRHDDEFEALVGLVKDEVRRVRRGAAKVSGLSETASSRILRRVASDYRDLPVSYRFHHVIWISPGRIGLFPDGERSRSVLHSIIGEIVYSLGRQRVTGTLDPMVAIRSIRGVIGGRRWRDSEPILFVIDGFEELVTKSENKRDAFDELFLYLPTESVALYARPSQDESQPTEASHVDPVDAGLARDAEGEEPDWAKLIPIDVCVSLLEDGHPDSEHTSGQVLVALCLVATPVAGEELALMLEVTLRDLDIALEELLEKRLIEGHGRTPIEEAQDSSATKEEPGSEHRGSLGVLNPIRRSVLEEPRFREELLSIASKLLRWAEATVEGFSNWEEDNAQLERLTQQLPNVLAIFEACCWLTFLDPRAFDQEEVDRHLWLGTDLSYILYNVGRWAEAKEMLDYLAQRAEEDVAESEGEKALTPSELHTFRREVLILQSRYLEHAGSTEAEFASAVEKAEEAIEIARERVEGGDPEYEPGDNTYAPNRLTLARQRARAQIAQALALLKTRKVTEAENILQPILFDRDFDGPSGVRADLDEQREERERQRESQLIVADASRALAGVRLHQLSDETTDPPDTNRIFEELDKGQAALSTLNNRRTRGHTALRRGDILYNLGNQIAARRYYARSLLIAIEFRDRFLEAGAKLGIANCDRDPNLAEESSLIYGDLGLDEQLHFAEDCVFRLKHEAEAGRYAARPRVIAVVGIPGTGKSVVTRTAGSVLAEWGYEPAIRQHDIIDHIRNGEDVDLSKVQETIIKPMETEIESAGRRTVGLVKIPTGRFEELFRPWIEGERDLLEQMLCIRMEGTRELLRARNERRRSGQLKNVTLNQMIDQCEMQDPTRLGFLTWESAFQAHGGAMVTIDSAGSILGLEHRIRSVLALSYLGHQQLVHLKVSKRLIS